NGTDAIHLALLAAGVGPGDEVVVPALTSTFTALAVSMAGATPVFADVDPGTGTLDPAAFEAAITPQT
ncbi:MAG: aminotransferase class I/II-fold pyridoxal phosphate-dependent enzyme, partial [Anaerolineae bacterium]|nr:aminotransferase class I/II-fold pyridoxal phosphate-dependent enzyme [Anaerolineae bacterium]